MDTYKKTFNSRNAYEAEPFMKMMNIYTDAFKAQESRVDDQLAIKMESYNMGQML